MDLKDIGLILKAEREKRGYSQEDVYRATKISIMNIDALERGDFETLPHPVYTRAFIKNYAEFLGIDPKEFLEIYESHHVSQQSKHKKIDSLEEFNGIKYKKWIWILVICFSLFIIICIIYFKIESSNSRSQISNKNTVKHTTMKTKNEVSVNNETETKKINALQNNTNGLENELNSTNQTNINMDSINDTRSNTGPNLAFTNKTISTKIDQNNSPETKVLENNIKEKPAQNDFHIVEISAKDNCWVMGWIDGNSTKQKLLSKGDEIEFKFKQNLKLKVGNLGGIDIFYDGKKVDTNGKSGQVKTLNFPIHD